MTERRTGERRISDAPSGSPACREWYGRLHQLWTRAVGKEGYIKEDWQKFSDCLEKKIPWRVRGG